MEYTAILALFLASSQAIKIRGVYTDENDDLFDPEDTPAALAQKLPK